MKLRNILSIILVTFAVMSCSTESDLLNEMSNPNVPTASTAEVAYVGINVKSATVQTKAGEAIAPATEQKIENAVFFLLEGENVIGFGNEANAKIFTKTRTGMKVCVIANITGETKAALSGLKTLDAINAVTFSAADLKLMPKVGFNEVTFDKTGSSSTTGVPTCTVTVTVAQKTACIRLASCVVEGFSTGKPVDNVVLTKIAIANVNTQGRVDNGNVDALDAFGAGAKDVSYNLWNEAGQVKDTFKAADFLSFRNTSAIKTAMTLTFTVDGEVKKLTFNIKANEEAEQIENGYLYNVNVTVKVNGSTIEPIITFTVKDWTGSSVNVDMEEVIK